MIYCSFDMTLLENHLFVKAKKFQFYVDIVNFGGFVVQRGSLKADPDKAKEWPRSTNTKSLQRFLEFANIYRKFIKNYSNITNPLNRLTFTATTFSWTD